MLKELTLKTTLTLVALSLLAIFIFGCDSAEKKSPVKSEITFVKDYQVALDMAKKNGQSVIIDFYTDWCYWCKVLDTVTYIDPTVIAFSDSIVFAKINAEVDTLIAQKYSITGYPTIVIVDADGNEIDRIVGYLPGEPFLEEVHNYLNGIGTLDDLLKRAETEPSMEIYSALGDKYAGRGMYDKAIEYYQKVVDGDPDNADGFTDMALIAIGETMANLKEFDKAIAHYESIAQKYKGDSVAVSAKSSIGETYVRMKEFDKAIAQFDTIIKEFKGTDAAADAMLWKGYIYRSKTTDTASAIKVYEEFLKVFPTHADTMHAKQKLEELTNPPAPETEE
ncbi:MAG: tetratricopeptide repeat protein [Candidatus Zixiibacteriota bacterium]